MITEEWSYGGNLRLSFYISLLQLQIQRAGDSVRITRINQSRFVEYTLDIQHDEANILLIDALIRAHFSYIMLVMKTNISIHYNEIYMRRRQHVGTLVSLGIAGVAGCSVIDTGFAYSSECDSKTSNETQNSETSIIVTNLNVSETTVTVSDSVQATSTDVLMQDP